MERISASSLSRREFIRQAACAAVGTAAMTCAIRDLPADLPAGWPVKVTYSYEPNGRLRVSARLKGHTAGVSADFERENRLPEDDLDLWSHFVEKELRDLAE